MAEAVQDPSLYRSLSRPFASEEAANKNLVSFYEAVTEARSKYGIPDVYVIVLLNATGDCEDEIRLTSTMQRGDSLKAEVMTAMAFGQELRLAKARLADIIAAEEQGG